MQRSAKFTLAAIILVCTLPVVASYTTYYFWQPDDTMNYGELLEPVALPEVNAPELTQRGEGGEHPYALRGHWTMIYTSGPQCAADCEQALYAMRQSWLAQGEDMRRLERLWLVKGDTVPSADGLKAQRGLNVAQAPEEWLQALPGAQTEGHIYLVDPLGNAMLRFPADPDVKRMIKDLQRLLKYSRLG